MSPFGTGPSGSHGPRECAGINAWWHGLAITGTDNRCRSRSEPYQADGFARQAMSETLFDTRSRVLRIGRVKRHPSRNRVTSTLPRQARRQLCTPARKRAVDQLDAPRLPRLVDWHEVPAGRDQHGNVVVVRPSKADHVGCNATIDTVPFRPPRVRTSSQALGGRALAGGTHGWRAPPLAWHDRNTHAGMRVRHGHHGRRPSVKRLISFASRVMRAMEDQLLMLTRGSDIDDHECRERERWPGPFQGSACCRRKIPDLRFRPAPHAGQHCRSPGMPGQRQAHGPSERSRREFPAVSRTTGCKTATRESGTRDFPRTTSGNSCPTCCCAGKT